MIPSHSSAFIPPQASPFWASPLEFSPKVGRQFRGFWMLGFHGSRAPLLPNGSLGGDRRESKRKSLHVPISMQGQGCCGKQCLQKRAAVGVPQLHGRPGRDRVTAIWLQLEGAEGQLALAGAVACLLREDTSRVMHLLSYRWALQLLAAEIGKPLIFCCPGTGTKVRKTLSIFCIW